MSFTNDLCFIVLRTLLITTGTLGMMMSTTVFKYSKKRTLSIFSIYLLWVAASSWIIVRFWGFQMLLSLFLLTISAPAVYLTYRMAKSSPSQAVFNHMTQIAFSLVLTVPMGLLKGLWEEQWGFDLLFRALLYAAVITLEWHFLRPTFLLLTEIIQNGWLILSLIPVAFTVLLTFVGVYPYYYLIDLKNLWYILAITLVMLIVYGAVFQSVIQQYRIRILGHNLELLRLQVSAFSMQSELIRESEEQLRIERHDLRHRFQTLTELIKQGKTNEALAYIGSSKARLNEHKAIQWCQNPILNAVFLSYFRQAEQMHIQVSTNLAIPDKLPVDAAELSTVFANALENAIHACSRLPQEERRIICRCISRPQLMFEISNPYAGKVIFDCHGLPVAAENGHGIGVRATAAFCKKHGALCTYKAENGWFAIQIVL
ncbi:MAG: ATP-binding protein [Lachnospiraceae bacterium]